MILQSLSNKYVQNLRNQAVDMTRMAKQFLDQEDKIDIAQHLLGEASSSIAMIISYKQLHDPDDKKGFGINYRQLAEINLQLSRSYSDSQKKYEYLSKALEWVAKAHECLPDDLYVHLQMAEVYDASAKFYANAHDFENAVKYTLLALDKYTEYKATDQKYQERYAYFHRQLGYLKFNLAKNQPILSDQKKYFIESIKHYWLSINSGLIQEEAITGYFQVCRYFASLYIQFKKKHQTLFDASEFQLLVTSCEQAYGLAEQAKNHEVCADFCNYLGKAHRLNSDLNDLEIAKNFDEAARWFELGMVHEINLHSISRDTIHYLHNRHALEKLYRAMASWRLKHAKDLGQIDVAREWAIMADNLGKTNAEPRKQAYSRLIIAISFWKQNHVKDAFDNYVIAFTQLDQYYRNETDQVLFDLDIFDKDFKQKYNQIMRDEKELDEDFIRLCDKKFNLASEALKQVNKNNSNIT